MPKKPDYPFEVYLTHLLSEKDELQKAWARTKSALATEKAEWRRLEEETKQLQGEIQRWKKEYNDGLGAGSLSALEMTSRRDHLRRLDGDLGDQKRRELAQKRAVEKARRRDETAEAAFLEKSNEVQVHEDRKEQWKKDLKREALRREQKQLEEISTAMHERRQRENRE